MVPAAVTRAVIDDSWAAITAWATRHDWAITLDGDAPTLTAITSHPKTDAPVTFCAVLDGFPALPPAWTCLAPNGISAKSAYPAPGSVSGVNSSIFHPSGLLCAHWNRHAYHVHGGPHGDWELTLWKTAGPGTARAETLPDMLAIIAVHLAVSPGMLS